MVDKNASKRNNVKVRLTAEGWAFSIILLFVTISAILRNVNLLIILAGMMIVALILSWRTQMHLLRSIIARRTIPSHVHAGQLLRLQWECSNHSRRLAVWNMNVTDRVGWLESPGARVVNKKDLKKLRRKSRSLAMINFPEVLPQESKFASYKTMFANRGSYAVGPAQLSTHFPFGLLRSTLRLGAQKTIAVAPRLGTLSPIWDQRLQSIVCGNESIKRRRGMEEDEFYALRRWRSGDSFRHINWRTTAKFGHPMIKQFDQQSNRDLAIVLDLYVPDSQEIFDGELGSLENWATKCETALSFAATVIAQSSSAVQGQIALSVCGEQAEIVAERYHREMIAAIMKSLALAKPTTTPDLGPAILEVTSSVSPGTPIFVVSSREMPDSHLTWGLSETELNQLQPNIRWLQVGSGDFSSLFSDHATEESTRMKKVRDTWSQHVSG